MAVSEFFSDDDLITQLRLQFSDEQQWDMDFRTVFNQIEDIGKVFYLEFRGRKFNIDKITGTVTEVNPKEEIQIEQSEMEEETDD